MEKHTPKPWKIDGHSIIHYGQSSAEYVAVVALQKNMDLISAAPDLLEALEMILQDYDGNWANYERAKRAVQKARGE